MRVVALFRVSTEHQENQGVSLDAQQRRYRELAAANGWQTVAEFRGVESAAKAASERAVLQQVLACIREREVESVWVFEQSRLTRGDELEVALLTRELRERGIAVVVGGSAPRRLDDITDSLAFGLQALVDHAEVLRIRERMTRGKRERARRGLKTGGAAPYGYRNPPPGDPHRGQLQVYEEEARVVRRIFAEVAGGVSIGRLLVRLNQEGIPSPRGGRWGITTVRRILVHPAYVGTMTCSVWVPRDTECRTHRMDLSNPRAIVTEGAHEPIITPKLQAAANAQIHGHGTGRPGMLTGLLWIDGERVGIDVADGRRYYRAVGRTGPPWVQTEEVNTLVWAGFGSLVSQPAALQRLLARAGTEDDRASVEEKEVRAMEQTRSKLTARLARLVTMRSDGEIDRATYQEHTAGAQRQLREVEQALRDVRGQPRPAGDYFAKAARAVRALVSDSCLSPEQRRRVLRSMVARVDVSLRSSEAQAKDRAGRFQRSKRWRVEDVLLHLHRVPGPDTASASCVRSLVTVQVVAGGEVVERLRREHVRWRTAA